MKINKFLLLIAMALINSFSHAQKTVYDANAQVRDIGTFTGVTVSSAIDLYISMGTEAVVAVSASEKSYLEMITTEVKNGMLYIGFNGKGLSWSPKNLKAYVSVRTITKLKASGACNVYVDGSLNAPDLELELSGASDFKGEVNAQNLRLDASGSSDYTISGKVVNAKIRVSGSSDVKGFELVTENCNVEASGSSDVHIAVTKQLKVDASGSSDVIYKGEPAVKEVRSSGSSDIRNAGGNKTSN